MRRVLGVAFLVALIAVIVAVVEVPILAAPLAVAYFVPDASVHLPSMGGVVMLIVGGFLALISYRILCVIATFFTMAIKVEWLTIPIAWLLYVVGLALFYEQYCDPWWVCVLAAAVVAITATLLEYVFDVVRERVRLSWLSSALTPGQPQTQSGH